MAISEVELSVLNEAEVHLKILQYGKLQVGVLTEVGGRVVSLRIQGGFNLLKSDPANWAPDQFIVASIDSPWKAFDGHVYWVSPQCDWWNQQEIAPHRRGDIWPPDPYLIYSPYKVLEESSSKLVLESPYSPVSGIKLIKTIKILSENEVYLSARAVNLREEPVQWGLWSNTRFYGDTPFYVSLKGSSLDSIRYEGDRVFPLERDLSPGLFRLSYDAVDLKAKEMAAVKAFIPTEDARVYALCGEYVWSKKCLNQAAGVIHPKQAPVEVYLKKHRDQSQSLLELEFHSACQTLGPGECCIIEETWKIQPQAEGPSVFQQ